MAAEIERTLMPNTYVKLLTQEFHDHAAIAAGTGIAPEELAEYPHPVSVRQHLQCVENILPLRQSPDWHLQWGRRMAEHFHGVVTMAWLTAPTLGDGLDAFIKYMPSRVPYLRWQGSMSETEFSCEVAALIDLGPVGRMLIEVPLIVMYEYTRAMRYGSSAAAEINLTYAPPPYHELYVHWFECPVEFERERNALVIPIEWRAAQNADFDEAMWNASIARCETMYTGSDERNTLNKVRQILFNALEDPDQVAFPTLEIVAERLHTSSRTLIRRLRAMDTTFQAITEDVRKLRARELLANQTNRLQDIAKHLGYEDISNFRRAFKRWYAMTPKDYRERILNRL